MYKELSGYHDMTLKKFENLIKKDGWNSLEHFNHIIEVILRTLHNKKIGMSDFMIWLNIVTMCGIPALYVDDNGLLKENDFLGDVLLIILQACEERDDGLPEFIIWLNIVDNCFIDIPWDRNESQLDSVVCSAGVSGQDNITPKP